MCNLFFVKSQDSNPLEISKDSITRALKERIELKIPVSAFFHFGLNACIENENNEN